MKTRIAINGFGRIGRNVLRAIFESGRKDIEVVASTISARSRPTPTCCATIRVHGRFPA
jgi:glyceraldehyde 3-phosphate dehydrogenase